MGDGRPAAIRAGDEIGRFVRGAVRPGSGLAGRRTKPGRSVQWQVSQSMALASMSAAIHRGVIARSSDSRTFRNIPAAARKKVFL
jgi:hypothetical protein